VLTKKKNYFIEVPLQWQIFHRGGQIGTQVFPLINWFNGTTGISYEHKISPGNQIKKFRMDNYVLLYEDFSSQKAAIFSSGRALYLNFSLQTKWLDVMASYWLSDQFRSFQGGNVYQSIAVFPLRAEAGDTISKPVYTHPRAGITPQESYNKEPYREKDRELLILRFMRDFNIINGLTLTLRFEPIYNLHRRTFEFSHGLYVTYQQDFLLKKVIPQQK
jgi:hypothetical protein